MYPRVNEYTAKCACINDGATLKEVTALDSLQ